MAQEAWKGAGEVVVVCMLFNSILVEAFGRGRCVQTLCMWAPFLCGVLRSETLVYNRSLWTATASRSFPEAELLS